MRYIYGPISSRRLGVSLGITCVDYKTCSLDCIYCQLGKTETKTISREEYVKIDDIITELKEFLRQKQQKDISLDYITLSGFGEPTLNIKIGRLIDNIKHIASIPIAVLTNSTLLIEEQLRKELLNADLICPSLDAPTQEIFERIDRPQAGINIENVIKGLISLRNEFRGKIYLEIMLVKGINDGITEAERFKEIIKLVRPDKIQLNTPTRYTTEQNIMPPEKERLIQIKEILGENCEIL